jgi:pimeloyl-ACP methyl ester carboxylesterase
LTVAIPTLSIGHAADEIATGAQNQPADSNQKLAGTWLGPLKVGVVELRLALKIKLSNAGELSATLDSIDQNAKDLAVNTITFSDGQLVAELNAIGGKFVGKLSDDGQNLVGTWTQGPNELPLTLKKTEGEFTLKRPQEPKPPFPYKAEEVTFENTQDEIELAGTLTIPDGAGPFPAVLLVSGSGPQDRDEALLGHKPFLVLADHLTRHGIAVLRYDDRGIGKSKGNFGSATTVEFSRDAAAGIRYLQQRPEIDKQKVGICGHSEGGLVAPLVAVETNAVAFIVLMAGPGVPGTDILHKQGELIARSMGADEQTIQLNLRIQQQLFEHMRGDETSEGVKAKVQELIESIEDEATREQAEKNMQGQMGVLDSTWFRYFLFYDPRPTLKQVKCPVLALNGEKDLQVAPTQNLPEIRQALEAGGNRRLTTREFPQLNHLFQTCQSGAVSEYGQIEETIAPVVLECISDWILEVTK